MLAELCETCIEEKYALNIVAPTADVRGAAE